MNWWTTCPFYKFVDSVKACSNCKINQDSDTLPPTFSRFKWYIKSFGYNQKYTKIII